MKFVFAPALVDWSPVACVSANGGGEDGQPAVVNGLEASHALAPVYGVSSSATGSVRHSSGLAIGASAPPVSLRIRSLKGSGGLSVNVVSS